MIANTVMCGKVPALLFRNNTIVLCETANWDIGRFIEIAYVGTCNVFTDDIAH